MVFLSGLLTGALYFSDNTALTASEAMVPQNLTVARFGHLLNIVTHTVYTSGLRLRDGGPKLRADGPIAPEFIDDSSMAS